MNASKAVVAVVICIAQLLAIISVAQTTPSPLPNRIPKADPKKYQAIRDGQDWQNPKMSVRPEGIEVIGITPPGRGDPCRISPRHIGAFARFGLAVWASRSRFGCRGDRLKKRHTAYSSEPNKVAEDIAAARNRRRTLAVGLIVAKWRFHQKPLPWRLDGGFWCKRCFQQLRDKTVE
jgi:hypothetical protein